MDPVFVMFVRGLGVNVPCYKVAKKLVKNVFFLVHGLKDRIALNK